MGCVGSAAERPDGAWRQAGLVVVAGLATGVLTQLGQGILPEGWSQAANAISPWLLVAFLVGSAMSDVRRAAIAGIGVLVLALVGYDLAILVQYGYGPSLGPRVLWGTGAIAGGLGSGPPADGGAQGRIGGAPWGSGCSSRSSSGRGSTTRPSSRTRPSGPGSSSSACWCHWSSAGPEMIGSGPTWRPSRASPSVVSSATWPSPG